MRRVSLEVCGKVAAQEGSGGDQVRETVLSRGTWQWPILPPGPSDWKRGPGREDMTGGGLAGKACGLRAWKGGDEAALGHPLSSPLPTPCPAHSRCSRSRLHINEHKLANEATSVGSVMFGGDHGSRVMCFVLLQTRMRSSLV